MCRGNCQYSEMLLVDETERALTHGWDNHNTVAWWGCWMLSHSYYTQASLRKEIPLWPGSMLYKQNTAFVQTELLFFFFFSQNLLRWQGKQHTHFTTTIRWETRLSLPDSVSNQLNRNNYFILLLKVATLRPVVDIKSSTWLWYSKCAKRKNKKRNKYQKEIISGYLSSLGC